MSAINDAFDIITQLNKSVKDRKLLSSCQSRLIHPKPHLTCNIPVYPDVLRTSFYTVLEKVGVEILEVGYNLTTMGEKECSKNL